MKKSASSVAESTIRTFRVSGPDDLAVNFHTPTNLASRYSELGVRRSLLCVKGEILLSCDINDVFEGLRTAGKYIKMRFDI